MLPVTDDTGTGMMLRVTREQAGYSAQWISSLTIFACVGGRNPELSRRLRADFVPEDIPLVLMANAGVVAATADHAPESSDRLVGYLLQACAASAADELPPPATPRRMYRALTGTSPADPLAGDQRGRAGRFLIRIDGLPRRRS